MADWISVEERLPPPDQKVLAHDHGDTFFAWLSQQPDPYGRGYWREDYGDGVAFPTVTHWMPLPDPPEEE